MCRQALPEKQAHGAVQKAFHQYGRGDGVRRFGPKTDGHHSLQRSKGGRFFFPVWSNTTLFLKSRDEEEESGDSGFSIVCSVKKDGGIPEFSFTLSRDLRRFSGCDMIQRRLSGYFHFIQINAAAFYKRKQFSIVIW